MADANAWMPLYIGDYLADTMHLDGPQHGAYILLILHYWRSGPLPDDDRSLATIARTERKEWLKMSAVIRAFFYADDGRLRHKRIDYELGNALAMVEQRRLAGRASAEARARHREANGMPNENSTSVGTGASTGRLRNGRPSPSPKKESKIQPSADAGASPMDAKSALFGEGLATLIRLTGKPDKAARSLLGSLVNDLGNDHEAVLALIRDTNERGVADPVSWLKGAAKARAIPKPINGHHAPLFDKPDPWGINAWTARQPDVKPETNPLTAQQEPCINGWLIEDSAERIAGAAGLPATWRGSWDVLGKWMREDVELTEPALTAIKAQADRMRAQGQTVGSIAVFDQAVRQIARAV